MLQFILVNRQFNVFRIYLKTSHVTVYLKKAASKRKKKPYLKTSHVTVYRDMDMKIVVDYGFKNISCYSLSQSTILHV